MFWSNIIIIIIKINTVILNVIPSIFFISHYIILCTPVNIQTKSLKRKSKIIFYPIFKNKNYGDFKDS